MILLLAKFLPSNRGKYTPVVTNGQVIVRNKGLTTATITWVYGGETSTETLARGQVLYLPQEVQVGKKVNTVYESITASYEGGHTVTFNVDKAATTLTVFECTDLVAEENTVIVTVINATNHEIEVHGASVDTTYDETITLPVYGLINLPLDVPFNDALNTVYSTITSSWDGSVQFIADLTVTPEPDPWHDYVINVVPNVPPAVGFILNLPESSIPVMPIAWNAAGSDSAGSVTFSPYLSSETYGDVFNEIFAAVQGGTIDSVGINQGGSSWNMDEFTIDGSTINMTDSVSGETFSLEGGGWIDDYNSIIISSYTIGITVDEEPSASSDLVIVLDNPVESTTPSYLIDTLTATTNVFLIQWYQQTYYENVDFTKSVTAGSTAALTFALGESEDPDYQEITINYTWDSESSSWQYSSHTQTGFNGIVFND